MLLRPFKNLLHNQFHSGYFCRNLLSRNRIVAPVDLIQKFISFIQHLLHFRRCVLSVSLLFSLMFFFFLFLLLKCLLRLRILQISLITGDQTGFLLINMSLTEPSVINHLFNIFFNEFHRLIYCCR